ALQRVVQRCLQKDPALRYPSVAELGAELLPHGPSRCRLSVERITKVITAAGLTDSKLSLPLSRAPASAVTAGTTQQAWDSSRSAGQGGSRWLAAAIAVGVLAAAGIAAGLLGVFDAPSEAPVLAAPLSESSAKAGVDSALTPEPDRVTGSERPNSLPGSAAPSSASPGSSASSSAPHLPKPAATSAPASRAPASPKLRQPRPTAETRPAKPIPPRPAAATAETEPKLRVPAVDLYQDRK